LLTHLFFYCLEDYTFIAMLVKIIFLEVSNAHYMEPLGRITLIVALLLMFAIRVFHVVYMRFQYVSFPLNWLQGSIKKLRKGKKDSLRWKEIMVKNIQVGDIIRMRYCDTSPVDLLVLDTSEQRYKENILKTNERKVNGENKTKIKRAIRDLGLRSLNFVVAPKDYLIKLGKKLNGYIEYDPPTGNKNNFWGIFKLKNDPKVTQVSEENILLAGSKLYSKEVIGMVLYTGDNCMIFQRNRSKKYESAERRVKQASIFKTANRLVLLCSGLSLVTSVIFMLTLLTDDDTFRMVKAVENITIGFNGPKKFFAILTFCMNLIPWPAKIVLEVSCLIFAIRIKYFGIPGKEEIAKAQQPTPVTPTISQQENSRNSKSRAGSHSRRKSNYVTSLSPVSKVSDEGSPITPRANFRRKTSGRGLNGTLINPLAEPTSPGIKKKANIKGTKIGGDVKGSDKLGESEITSMMANHLNIINYTVLPDLGIIDQVFLDKTDTLTLGSMRVAELSTYMKCYLLPHSEMDQMISDCKANPDAFSYEDDAVKIVESEDYSEKSQEYLKELEGTYYREVIDEDSSLDPIIDPRLFPDYGALTTGKKNEGQTQITLEVNRSMKGVPELRNSALRRGDETQRLSSTLIYPGLDGGRDSPRDYYEKNTEMKQLNALEKKFKQDMLMKQTLPASSTMPRKTTIGKSQNAGPKSPTNEEDTGSVQEEEYTGDNRINFKIEKKLTDKNFIYDLHSKKEHLVEMLNYLLICNEGSSVVENNSERCQISEIYEPRR
jgi:hypothetical protein